VGGEERGKRRGGRRGINGVVGVESGEGGVKRGRERVKEEVEGGREGGIRSSGGGERWGENLSPAKSLSSTGGRALGANKGLVQEGRWLCWGSHAECRRCSCSL